MPFSRSQNSRTAKKSAFIRSTLRSYPANKKVGRYASSDFRALDDPANFTVLKGQLKELTRTRQAQTNPSRYRWKLGFGMKNRNPGCEAGWLTCLLALVRVLDFAFVRSRMG
jgi:hypothetical protein